MQRVARFDPTSATTGTFNTQANVARGKIVIINDSSTNIDLTFPNGFTETAPARLARLFSLDGVQPGLWTWSQMPFGTLAPAVVSQVTVIHYEEYEHIPEQFPAALARP
jgi:hypothetical protein